MVTRLESSHTTGVPHSQRTPPRCAGGVVQMRFASFSVSTREGAPRRTGCPTPGTGGVQLQCTWLSRTCIYTYTLPQCKEDALGALGAASSHRVPAARCPPLVRRTCRSHAMMRSGPLRLSTFPRIPFNSLSLSSPLVFAGPHRRLSACGSPFPPPPCTTASRVPLHRNGHFRGELVSRENHLPPLSPRDSGSG